jgi:catechol 2,3-dioxygenase-like lactoylglutathione lyase family enzyme
MDIRVFWILNSQNKIMEKHLALVALVVEDYNEAIEFYTVKLGFILQEDTRLSPEKRWVRVAPASGTGCGLLLAKAATEEQRARIGNQTGGRVFLFLHTPDFWRDFREMKAKGVEFISEPRTETYGTVAVFLDLYGNRWDLIGPAN